jgi:hypothetical protein
MKFDDRNPSLILILDKIVNEILTSVVTTNYFALNDEQKFVIQEISFKIIKNTITYNTSLSDDDLKTFMKVLQKKNEQTENYEIAQILSDIFINYNKFKINNKKDVKKKQE